MSYIGRAPGFGIRNRYYYTATASQTTFSGADDNGQTLAYADSKYLDVYLNGVLLVAGTDYTATTLTSVTLTSGASASDIVEIVAYDIFSVADTVSASQGGTFDGEVTFADGVVVSGGTGDNTLSIPDNLASAFDITESTNSYLKFVTTDSSEAIVAGKTLQTALVEPTTDDSSDLGTSSKRFQDLYLSGGVYLGGTGAANQLDDYEEGTWTVSWGNLTGTPGNLTGYYVKIGKTVHIDYYADSGSISGTRNSVNFSLPFTPAHNAAGSMIQQSVQSPSSLLIFFNGNAYPFTFSGDEFVFSATYQTS